MRGSCQPANSTASRSVPTTASTTVIRFASPFEQLIIERRTASAVSVEDMARDATDAREPVPARRAHRTEGGEACLG